MKEQDSLNRRDFLGKTTLLATAAGIVAGAKKTRAQINNAAGVTPARVGVGFIGVGIRGTLLLEATQQVAGVEIVAAADLYKGHLERAKELTNGKIITTG